MWNFIKYSSYSDDPLTPPTQKTYSVAAQEIHQLKAQVAQGPLQSLRPPAD